MTKRVLALIIAGGLLAATAACKGSSDATATPQDGGGGGLGPTTKVTVDVTGEVTANGTSDALPATYSGVDYTSCAAYGKGESRDGKLYFIGDGTTSTTTVNADGGGKWEFTGLTVQNRDNTQTPGKLSGTVTWTCSDKG